MPAPPASSERFTVRLETPAGERRTIAVGAAEHILDAARAAGMDLPSLCEQGWCITCAVRVLEGTIDQSDSRRFYAEDREAGFALICTGRPRSDLVLLTHQTEAMRTHRVERGLPVPRGT